MEEVFRQHVVADDKEHGLVGFERHGGIDCIRIVSWANGQTSVVEFELAGAARVAELILHALATKNRPDEESVYSFPRARPKGR